MPTYSGSFPLAAEGLAVMVKTAAGVVLTDPAPGVVGTTQTDDGALAYSYVYADGDDGTVLTASVSSSALGTFSTSLVLDTAASLAAGGGGATETGDGPPAADPAAAGAGAQYVDSTNGALYMVILNPAIEAEEWVLVCGEIDGDLEQQGVVSGNGLILAGSSTATPRLVGITDVDAYNNSGLGIYWTGTGTDGQQGVEVRAGSGGIQLFTTDGVYLDSALHADGPLATKGDEPSDGSISAGKVFIWFDDTNGAASVNFKGKTADGTVVGATVALS